MISIDLPWPSRDLHPNARVHWAKKARATKKARSDAAICTRAAGIRRNDPDIPQALKVTVIFYPPNNHKHDIDGCLSALKPSLDGVADVIGVDDSKWSIALRKDKVREGGAVRLELEAAPEDWITREAIKFRNERRIAHIDEVVAAVVGSRK